MDETENRKRLPPWAGKLLIWCLPALVLLLLNVVVFHLVPAKDTIITFCAIVILGLMVTRLIFLFRSERAPGAQAWRGVLWIVLLVVLGFFSLFMPRTNHLHTRVMAPRLFESWTAKICGDTVPRPIELGTPKSAVVHIYRKSAAIFESRSYTLLCRYDEDDYEEEKAALETRYHFRNEPMKTGLGEPETIEPYVRIGDDFFRVVIPGDGDELHEDSFFADCFYKRCFLVVINDVRHEIAYVIFQDLDLDCAGDLADFLNEYCGWKYIR